MVTGVRLYAVVQIFLWFENIQTILILIFLCLKLR